MSMRKLNYNIFFVRKWGKDQLIKIPVNNVGSATDAGAIKVGYGDSALPTTYIMQNTPGIPGGCETGDWFGYFVATGNFNNDEYDDIAVSS